MENRICPFKVEALLSSGEYFNVPVEARRQAFKCSREECMHYKLHSLNDNDRCLRKAK